MSQSTNVAAAATTTEYMPRVEMDGAKGVIVTVKQRKLVFREKARKQSFVMTMTTMAEGVGAGTWCGLIGHTRSGALS